MPQEYSFEPDPTPEYSFEPEASNENVYRAETGSIINAPPDLKGKEIEYYDDVQNLGKKSGDYLGFVSTVVTEDIPSGIARSGINIYDAMTAGTLRQLGDARKEVFEQKPFKDMSALERINAFTDSVPSLKTMLFGSIRDRELQSGWLSRLFIPRDAGLKKADELIAASESIHEDNQRFIQKNFPDKEGAHGVIQDVAGVATTAGAALGLNFLTKSPTTAAVFFGSLQKNSVYLEAKGKGKSNEEADTISTNAGYIEGGLEFLGGAVAIKAFQNSKGILKYGITALEEATQEFLQTGGEEAVTQMSGVRPVDIQRAAKSMAYSFGLGFIGGGGAAVVIDQVMKTAKEEGIPEPVAKAFADKMQEAGPQIEAEMTQIIQDQTSPMRSDPENEAASAKIMQDFIDGKDIDISSLSEEEQAAIREFSQRAVDRIGPEKVDFTPQITVKRQPMTLRNFIRKLGGISDDGGDLSYMGLDKDPKFKGIINNKKGLPPDRVRELAQEAGYLKQDDPNAPSESTIQDLYDAISREIAGENVYRASDMDQAIAHEESKTQADFYQEAQNTYDQAKSKGIDLTKEEAIDVTHLIRGGEDFQDAIDTVLEGGAQQRESAIAEGDIKGKNTKLFSLNEVIAAVRKSFKRAHAATKADVKNVQAELIKSLDESGLEASDKAKFIKTIKNIQTAKQLNKQAPEIEARVMELLDAQQRRETIAAIRKIVGKVKKSKVIAVDFAKQIEGLFNEIDTKQRRPETLETLQKTLDFMNKNPDAKMPRNVLKKLEVLNKKRLENISTEELTDLHEELQKLVAQGKTKLELMKAKKDRIKAERIAELQDGSEPLSGRNVKRAPIGERLATMEEIRNKYAEATNKARRGLVGLNPMDVFFDMLDKVKNYKGANHKIFKRTIDRAYSKYLNLKEDATRDVKNLTDKLKLDEKNFEKIGVYAAAQQEGGVEKLLETGITQEEIDGLTLTDGEMEMYQLMRTKLDEMLPAIKEVMRVVYNQDVEAVKDYFPFLSDFEAMKDFEVQDMIGDNVPTIGRKKNVEKGFTIKRVLGKQKIRIDALGVFLKHVDNAAYLIEVGADIKALGEIATSQEYGDAVGDIGQEMVVEWINLLARKGNAPGRIPILDAFRRNTGLAVLGFKLSSVMIQPTALADGSALVGGGYVARGITQVAQPEWRQFLYDNMPELRERVGDDPNYADMGGKGIIGNVNEVGFWTLKKLDHLSASAVAAGAYTKSVEERGGTVDLSNPDPQGVEDAQLMMRRTQSSPFAKDAPPVISRGGMTGNPSVDKLIFQFQSFMLNRWSLIKHDMWEAGIRDGNTAQALNIATWLLIATAAEIGIRRAAKEIIAALTGDDPKPWEETIKKEVAMNALGTVPFVSDAVMGLAMIPGVPDSVTGLSYYSNPIPAVAISNQIINELDLAAKSKKPETKARHQASAAILTVGASLGISGALQLQQIQSKAMKPEKGKGKTNKRKAFNE